MLPSVPMLKSLSCQVGGRAKLEGCGQDGMVTSSPVGTRRCDCVCTSAALQAESCCVFHHKPRLGTVGCLRAQWDGAVPSWRDLGVHCSQSRAGFSVPTTGMWTDILFSLNSLTGASAAVSLVREAQEGMDGRGMAVGPVLCLSWLPVL